MKIKSKRRRQSARERARDRAFRAAWIAGLFRTIWSDRRVGPELGRAVANLGAWPKLNGDAGGMDIFRCPS